MDRVTWARALAERLLAGPLPRRWSHVQGVGRKAESIAHIVGEDAGILICAAWLHDIGYSPSLVQTGLHSLDGARYLRDFENAASEVCRLVAHHSEATVEASNRGLTDTLNREFPALDGPLADALTYCDMTTSPDGHSVQVTDRLDEIAARYGPRTLVGRSINQARKSIEEAVRAIESVATDATHPRSVD
jgi:hypothetical protein